MCRPRLVAALLAAPQALLEEGSRGFKIVQVQRWLPQKAIGHVDLFLVSQALPDRQRCLPVRARHRVVSLTKGKKTCCVVSPGVKLRVLQPCRADPRQQVCKVL